MSTKSLGPDIDCNKLKELLPDYLDQTLQDHICQELRSHLEDCPDCRIFVRTVEMTIVLYKHSPRHEVPEEVRIDIREHIRKKLDEGKGR